LENSLEALITLAAIKDRNAFNVLFEISRQEKLKFVRIKNTINIIKDNSLVKPIVIGENITIKGIVNDEDG